LGLGHFLKVGNAGAGVAEEPFRWDKHRVVPRGQQKNLYLLAVMNPDWTAHRQTIAMMVQCAGNVA